MDKIEYENDKNIKLSDLIKVIYCRELEDIAYIMTHITGEAKEDIKKRVIETILAEFNKKYGDVENEGHLLTLKRWKREYLKSVGEFILSYDYKLDLPSSHNKFFKNSISNGEYYDAGNIIRLERNTKNK